MALKNHLMDAAKAALKAQRWEVAENLLLSAQRLAPLDQFIRYSLAIAVHAQGRSQEAIALWKHILVNDPHNVLVLAKLGAALYDLGHEVDGLRLTSQAAELAPKNVGLLTNLSIAWMLTQNHQAALPILEQALLVSPGHIPLLFLKLECLSSLSQHTAARDLAFHILSVSTDPIVNRGTLCALMGAASQLSDWPVLATHHDQWKDAVLAPGATSASTMLMFAFDDPQLLFAVGAANTRAQRTGTRPSRAPTSDRICIGYLSADFREHPVAHMLLEVLAYHDRSRFRVVLISTSPIDSSAVAQQLLSHVDAHIDVSMADTLTARQLILSAGIEVLIDLSGMTTGHRALVLQTRPCPAQLLWLGCPTTTGLKHYDAFLVDNIIAPPGYDAWCHEPLLRLPCCYHPISTGLDIGLSQLTRESLGIPTDALLIGMLQTPNRIRPPFINRIVGILARHPTTHLIMRVVTEAQDQVMFLLAGMGLTAQRVSFIPHFPDRSDYLQLIRMVDLVIDSHPYGGHSTSGEAMALGTPVLTMLGNSIHARVAASMLHEVGLGDLVTHSSEEFTETLDALIGDPGLLAEWKRRFADASAKPKAERHARLTAALEACYIKVLNEAAAP